MNLETAIQNKAIVACADIAFLWRYQVGKFRSLYDDRVITVGIPGFPDTFGFRKSDGKFIVLEFKTPDGTLREDQKTFKETVGNNGFPIIYGVPRSVAEARNIILNG